MTPFKGGLSLSFLLNHAQRLVTAFFISSWIFFGFAVEW